MLHKHLAVGNQPHEPVNKTKRKEMQIVYFFLIISCVWVMYLFIFVRMNCVGVFVVSVLLFNIKYINALGVEFVIYFYLSICYV